MGSFKKYLSENEDLLSQINHELAELNADELDTLGYIIYNELFDMDDEDESDEVEDFKLEDIQAMIAELGPEFYQDILDMLEEIEDDSEEEEEDDSEEDDLEEGVSRTMKQKNFNRKKRKFMSNSKADMRKSKAKRKQDARASKSKRKRYYRANKAKIASYQKTRSDAIKKGKHKVKKRRNA
jgi:vacuolar-type H+-ATPase subunit I/STV1